MQVVEGLKAADSAVCARTRGLCNVYRGNHKGESET